MNHRVVTCICLHCWARFLYILCGQTMTLGLHPTRQQILTGPRWFLERTTHENFAVHCRKEKFFNLRNSVRKIGSSGSAYTCIYTVSQNKPTILLIHNLVCQFSKFFHLWIQQEICNKTLVMFPTINYVTTLPCETYNATFINLPTQLLQKLASKFISFLM